MNKSFKRKIKHQTIDLILFLIETIFFVLELCQTFQYIFEYQLLIMSIKQTQRITRSTLRSLDQRIWKEIAEKAVRKMPKFQLTNESNKVFHDFALMNGHDPKSFLNNLSQEEEKRETIYDNLLIGSLKKSVCARTMSETHAPFFEKSRKISFNLNIKTPNHSKTYTEEFHNNKIQKPCIRLFVSEICNQEQIIEGQLRKAKQENARYNRRLEEITRERISKSEQHTQNQKKKFKETKSFTYDYEGKLLGTKIQSNGNIKFVHIKSKFHQSINKEHKKLLEKLSKSKSSEITDKKVINFDERQCFQPPSDERMSKNIYPNIQNSISNIFREDKNIQMGVSIIDPSTNSKLFNNNHQNPFGKSLKLSDFKKSFKSSSMMGRKKAEKLFTIDQSSPSSEKEFMRIKTVSDAESKILSSAFSRYSKQIGKIRINNSKIFVQSFDKEKL